MDTVGELLSGDVSCEIVVSDDLHPPFVYRILPVSKRSTVGVEALRLGDGDVDRRLGVGPSELDALAFGSMFDSPDDAIEDVTVPALERQHGDERHVRSWTLERQKRIYRLADQSPRP